LAASLNDFVIKVASVNGSGSQSANSILLKSIFRMGVPVGGKNIFPSNIQGMPTWYFLRASAQGNTGFCSEADITVALNSQTVEEDHLAVPTGGFFIYDDGKIKSLKKREDVHYITVPFQELTNQATSQVKLKKYLTNMIYVGILAELLGLDGKVLEATIDGFFNKDADVLEANRKAVEVGRSFVSQHPSLKTFPFRVSALKQNEGKMLIDGNAAAALGLLVGGATFASWYPITPSTSLVESFEKYCRKYRKSADGKNNFAVVQAEDELSSICMVLGAGWNGARAFTATSGPGLSLMQEAAGYAYYAEIPCVVWDVQRVGPSTGMPTRTAQSDITSAHFSSHGDTRHPVLLPGNPFECYEFAQQALDLAEHLQTLVYVLSDLDIGMNVWRTDQLKYPQNPLNRGKVLSKEDLDRQAALGDRYYRYADKDSDGIAYRALPGTRHPDAAYLTRGSGHNSKGFYTEKSSEYVEVVDRLHKKWETANKLVPQSLCSGSRNEIGIIHYGSTIEIVDEAKGLLQEKGIACDSLRIRAIPFDEEIRKFILAKRAVYILDLNQNGQIFELLKARFPDCWRQMHSVTHYSGMPVQAMELAREVQMRERPVDGTKKAGDL
jgi:2-oxoglutarate ferredoxin oxidoreductase subunit alpha